MTIELSEYVIDAIANAVVKKMQEPKTDNITIPKEATNGDVLCMLFPNMRYTLSDKSQRVVTTIGVASSFDLEWWNAPYQGEESK